MKGHFTPQRHFGSVAAPGREGHHRFQARIDVEVAVLTRLECASRHESEHLIGVPTPCEVERPVAAHAVAQQRGVARVHQPAQKAAARSRQGRHAVQHRLIVLGAVEQRAGEGGFVSVRAVGVVDGGHHVPLAYQVLGQVAHQVAAAGIPVREDHQRILSTFGIRRGVAGGAAHEGERYHRALGVAGATAQCVFVHGALHLPGAQAGRVPDFDGQWAVRTRQCFGSRGHGRRSGNVEHVLANQRNGPHAH